VRAVIEAHTGTTPPPLPPQPSAAPYGRVALTQSVPLLGALHVLAPGDGAPARTPERMEAYGQRRAEASDKPLAWPGPEDDRDGV